MKMRLKTWSTLVLLLSIAMEAKAMGGNVVQAPSDQTQWDRLVSSTKHLPGANLLEFRSGNTAETASEKFYAAEAECSANALAILAVNDLLPYSTRSIRVGTKAVWNNETAVFLSQDFSDGKNFMFLCLVDEFGKLHRTRLLRPELQDHKYAIEIDMARYTYGSK